MNRGPLSEVVNYYYVANRIIMIHVVARKTFPIQLSTPSNLLLTDSDVARIPTVYLPTSFRQARAQTTSKHSSLLPWHDLDFEATPLNRVECIIVVVHTICTRARARPDRPDRSERQSHISGQI